MDERSKQEAEGELRSSQHRVSHTDLRDLLRDFEAMREVKVIEGADHVYSGVAERLADDVANWLAMRVL